MSKSTNVLFRQRSFSSPQSSDLSVEDPWSGIWGSDSCYYIIYVALDGMIRDIFGSFRAV